MHYNFRVYRPCGLLRGRGRHHSGWNAIGDGFCDFQNNNEQCGWDGGDCCQCTCVPPSYVHPNERAEPCTGPFACLEPTAPCVDDDLITTAVAESCDELALNDGLCDRRNNNAECLYDGGDCCECTCEAPEGGDEHSDTYNPSCYDFDCLDIEAPCFEGPAPGPTPGNDDEGSMSYGFDGMSYGFDGMSFWFEAPEPVPGTPAGAVEAGTLTEVSVSATKNDECPGASGGDVGCGPVGGGGCVAANTRDGVGGEAESRWSCATKLGDGAGPCEIEYTFSEPQFVVGIEVALWKGAERTRTLAVYLDGELVSTFETNLGSTSTTVSIGGSEVTSVKLEPVGLAPTDWISVLEVLIFVTP